MAQLGKLIVIDGVDGSGKATQTTLLVKQLRKLGVRVKQIDFPRYYQNFFGKFVGECLTGHYGDFVKLNPKIASLIFASDRFESSEQIRNWLKQGFVVVTDRYTSANQMFQGAKIKNLKERREFLKWEKQLEYEVFKIPKPDLTILLDISGEWAGKLLRLKNSENKKRYNKGRLDLHEVNNEYLGEVIKTAKNLAKGENKWRVIKCLSGERLLSRDEIGKLVYREVQTVLR